MQSIIKIEREIGGKRYIATATPNGDMTYSCCTFQQHAPGLGLHHLPAHDRLALSEHDARNQLTISLATLAVADATRKAANELAH